MKKIHKKKIKNIFVTTVVFCGFILVLAGCGNNIKKQMEKAMNDFNSGHYSEAKEEFNIILKEDSSNSEANLIVSIIDNFEHAKKLYENKEYDKSNEEISKIPGEYNNYNIKSDVDDLKENINKKIEQKKEEEKNTQNKEINYINTEENAIKKVSSVKEIKDLIEKGIKITYLPSKDIINNKDGIKVDVGENKEERVVFNWHYFVDYNGEVYKLNSMSDKYEKIN